MWTYLVVVFSLFGTLTWSQDGVQSRWKSLQEQHGYKPSDNFRGPNAGQDISPTNIQQHSVPLSGGGGSVSPNQHPYNGVPLSQRQIQQGRRVGGGSHGNGGNGTIEADPNIEPSQTTDIPELDAPDAPKVSGPSIGGNFWFWLAIIVLAVALIWIVIYLMRNRETADNRPVSYEALSEDVNPATISKTELELRLEEAMANGNYKECVRIYFLFAMKELINRRWIFWKKEKTNMHYIIEMQGKPGLASFEQIVNMYDLVWYGDYEIDEATYNAILPDLATAYQHIERINE